MMSQSQIAVRRLAAAMTHASADPCSMAAAAAAPRAFVAVSLRYSFSTSPARPKTATEAAKDTLKSVNRVVSDKLADSIDLGSNVANKAKDVGKEMAKGKVADKIDQAARKTGEIRGNVSSQAQQLKKDVEDKASEVANKAHKAADDIKNKM